MSRRNLNELDEEFNNFMYKVNQVNSIVKKLASDDKNLQEIGDLEAKEYLGETDDEKLSKISEDVDLKIKNNRTVINRVALLRDDNPSTQTPEAFMKEIERDADQRYKDKLKRKERMETFKKQATLAFRRGEFEKALSLYNKAVEQIKDSCLLYSNRALTYINLKFYDKAIDDCNLALQLNEDSLRARLLLAKAHYLNGNLKEFKKEVKETKVRNCEEIDFIEDFVKKLKISQS